MMIVESNEKVYTGPTWLAQQVNGLKNQNGTAVIVVHYDAYNRPIIDRNIGSAWDLSTPFTNPNTNETRNLVNWLLEIPYCYEDEQA